MDEQKDTFQKDLQVAKLYEEWSAKLISKITKMKFSHYIDDITESKIKMKEWDLCFIKDGKEITMEIKSDKQSHTGNIAIEYECSGKKSGIDYTKSDYWINIFPLINEVWMFKTKDLKEICELEGFKVRGGWEKRARLYLINRDYLKKEYKDKIKILNINVPIYE